ncbi:unnamed protein product [Blepharisma stoltei]|uniref:Uncharacterized protein n=1 Tax=Blepharisma stoltei TaxID=1481888 RepID=A0AAU9I774_9CILI|nr:unnamed protein product [Blepharisma stoltei]
MPLLIGIKTIYTKIIIFLVKKKIILENLWIKVLILFKWDAIYTLFFKIKQEISEFSIFVKNSHWIYIKII